MLNDKFLNLRTALILLFSTTHFMVFADEKNQNLGFVTVGSTGDCTYRTGDERIQNAIDSGAPEVRIAIGTYVENIQINQRSVALKGGYSSCAIANSGDQDADPTATIINGDDSDSVVRIFGSLDRYAITLSHLRLTNGRNSDTNPGGGISLMNANVNLQLNDIYIDNNTGSQGGGIAIFTGTTNVTAHNLMINGNIASSGGGVFCDGSGLATIIIDGDESNTYGIIGNLANNGNGGGVYLSNGCEFTSFVGTDVNTSEDNRGIFGNFATRNGGGLYVASESKALLFGNTQCTLDQSGTTCRGNNNKPINVTFNFADLDESGDGSGAGIFVTGNNSVVEVYNGLIKNNNTTRGNGGAVYLSSNARFISDSQFTNGTCWSPGSCNQFINNKASLGGVFKVETGSELTINRSVFSENLANVGNIAHANGSGTEINMQGNLIIENGDFSGDFSNRSLFELNNNASLNVSFSTIADNNLNNKTPLISNQSASVTVESSIISENEDLSVYSGSSAVSEHFNCLLVHESDSLDGVVQFITTQSNPEFIDRGNGNYHLDINLSPAIDYCNNQSGLFTDSDNDVRGWDWIQISDFQGPFDIGYDENTDIIFKNGFEL